MVAFIEDTHVNDRQNQRSSPAIIAALETKISVSRRRQRPNFRDAVLRSLISSTLVKRHKSRFAVIFLLIVLPKNLK